MSKAADVFYVYLMASRSRVLYCGVTGNLPERVSQHKAARNPRSFTARYRINRLVYYEEFASIQRAIEREKQLKGWRRARKVALIESVNLKWEDWSRQPRFGEGFRR